MLVLDTIVYLLHKTGFIWYSVLNQRDFKLQAQQKTRIDLVIMLIFILVFSALGTLLTKLVLLDLAQLKTTLGSLLGQIDVTIPGGLQPHIDQLID